MVCIEIGDLLLFQSISESLSSKIEWLQTHLAQNLVLGNHFPLFSGHYLDLLDDLLNHSISVITHRCTPIVFFVGFNDRLEVHQRLCVISSIGHGKSGKQLGGVVDE